MHNIDVNGSLVIGGYGKTLADMRRFVALANEYGLADETPCNAAVFIRVDAEAVQQSTLGAILHFGRAGEAGR